MSKYFIRLNVNLNLYVKSHVISYKNLNRYLIHRHNFDNFINLLDCIFKNWKKNNLTINEMVSIEWNRLIDFMGINMHMHDDDVGDFHLLKKKKHIIFPMLGENWKGQTHIDNFKMRSIYTYIYTYICVWRSRQIRHYFDNWIYLYIYISINIWFNT